MVTEYWGTRTDNGLVARARSTLSNSKIQALRKLSVEEDRVGVVLRGQVPLYYYKQLAQEVVRNELEDVAIFNEIEVVDPR